MQSSQLIGIVVVPAVVSLLLFAVFTYLYQQSRQPYFRLWQIGWAALFVHYVLIRWTFVEDVTGWTVAIWIASRAAFVLTFVCIFASTRAINQEFRLSRADLAIFGVGMLWMLMSIPSRLFRADYLGLGPVHLPLIRFEYGVAALLGYCSYRFLNESRKRGSAGYLVLSAGLMVWALLMILKYQRWFTAIFEGSDGHFLGPVPQMLIGIGMVMVLFEHERRMVQENLLAFSTLEVASTTSLDIARMSPNLDSFAARLSQVLQCPQVYIYINERWRDVIPPTAHGLHLEFRQAMEQPGGLGEYFSAQVRKRAEGLIQCPNVEKQTNKDEDPENAELRRIFSAQGMHCYTAVEIKTHDRNLGFLFFGHPHQGIGSAQLRLLRGLATQIAMTVENYILMHNAQRRTSEYELLTQIGQVVASRLDPDEILRSVHKELGRLFNTKSFYVAFKERDEIRFALEVEQGKIMPKRSRATTNGITEHILKTGQPLLIRNDMEQRREELGVVPTGRKARCFCGVPIILKGESVGVMAALHYEREYVYDRRDLDVMMTAAGQVAVALENARLFSEEQRRARQLELLNSISTLAISSQNPEQMLEEIMGEIRQNFSFDYIGIGIVDLTTKDIEIRAESRHARTLGKRIPLGVGILGRVARTSEMMLAQNTGESHLLGLMPDSRSVLCIPILYGETMMGVLNLESPRENAFSTDDVLIMRTLADLLATALHNAYVFNKMQEQSITDSLTGIKTRRFFLEALQAEWKRASRSGRPFSLVLIDLDKFKDVNDNMGHLEGDLVLARIGKLLEQKCRQSNTVARYGGDEFVILMPETSVEQAQILSERLRLWIATDPMLNERHITGSFGVATFPLHGATVEDIVRVADAGMYVSKHAGGNRVSTAEDVQEDTMPHDQVVRSYVEQFLRRENSTPGSADELAAMLRKLSAAVPEGRSAEAVMSALVALCRAGETREVCASGHGDAVARYSESIGRELMLPPDELADLIQAAKIHDVGKVLVPDKILNKPGSLSADEYHLVKAHATAGAQLVELLPGSSRLREFVRHHHEWFDGSGYPDRLIGEQIPLGARIIAVAEAYANMTTDRPYAEVKTSTQALTELENRSGTQFDGMLVRILAQQLKGERAAHSSR